MAAGDDPLYANKKLMVSQFTGGKTDLGSLFLASLDANLSIEILSDSALIYGSFKGCRRYAFFPPNDQVEKKNVLTQLLTEVLWEVYKEG